MAITLQWIYCLDRFHCHECFLALCLCFVALIIADFIIAIIVFDSYDLVFALHSYVNLFVFMSHSYDFVILFLSHSSNFYVFISFYNLFRIDVVIYYIAIFISEFNAIIFLQAATSWCKVDITSMDMGNTVASVQAWEVITALCISCQA